MGGAIESNCNGKNNSKSQYGDLSTTLRSGRDDSVFGGAGESNNKSKNNSNSNSQYSGPFATLRMTNVWVVR